MQTLRRDGSAGQPELAAQTLRTLGDVRSRVRVRQEREEQPIRRSDRGIELRYRHVIIGIMEQATAARSRASLLNFGETNAIDLTGDYRRRNSAKIGAENSDRYERRNRLSVL